jgi:methanogen homocitrate synthase
MNDLSSDYFKENAWWISSYNFKPEAAGEEIPRHPVQLHDATLRDGEQTPGVVFSIDDKLAIAEKLMEAGVKRIEAGMPAVSKDDFKAIQKISARHSDAEIYAFARATPGDINLVRDCGVKGVLIEIPIGYPKLLHQFGWTWENVLEKSVDCINHAKSQGLKTVYFPYDTTRAREEDLENLIRGIMRDAPPDAIGVIDTMGCATPAAIRYLVRKMKGLAPGVTIEIHTHNDFGLAVATELAGLSAGAEVAHTCVNGLGERTGNAALEEMVLALSILWGLETPYKPDKLASLCELVEKLSGVPCAPNKPFCGARNYTRESGIGADLVIKKPLAMFATDPALFGKHSDVALGKKSGRPNVTYHLDELGLAATDEQVGEILARVKEMGIKKKAPLSGGVRRDSRRLRSETPRGFLRRARLRRARPLSPFAGRSKFFAFLQRRRLRFA